jgi:predicted dehydrogenase
MRIAILGGGNNSAVGRAHISAIRLVGSVEIAAGCFNRDFVSNLNSAKEYGIDPSKVYKNLESMILGEKEKISAIIVLTPTQNHYKDVKNILEKGINVIYEISLCVSIAEADSLSAIAKKIKVKIYVTFNYTGYPMVREIKHRINLGLLGTVHTVNAIMPQEGFSKRKLDNDPITPQTWRLSDGRIPTLSLDLGVHLANLVTFLTGSHFAELTAVQNKRGNFNVIDDIHVIAKLSNFETCSMWYSKSALGKRNGLSIEIFGTEGSVSWIQENSEEFTSTDKYGNQSTINRGTQGLFVANENRYMRFKAGHPSGFIEAFANYYEDIFSSMSEPLKLKLPKMTFEGEDGLTGLKVMEAIASSNESKKWIRIND